MTVLLLILVSLGILSLAYHWKQANASHVVPRKTANAKVLKLLLISFSSCPKHCPLAVQDPFSLVTNKIKMTFQGILGSLSCLYLYIIRVMSVSLGNY